MNTHTRVSPINGRRSTITTSGVDGAWCAKCVEAGVVRWASSEIVAIWLVEADLDAVVWESEQRHAKKIAVVLFILAAVGVIIETVLR